MLWSRSGASAPLTVVYTLARSTTEHHAAPRSSQEHEKAPRALPQQLHEVSRGVEGVRECVAGQQLLRNTRGVARGTDRFGCGSLRMDVQWSMRPQPAVLTPHNTPSPKAGTRNPPPGR
eukprot:gene22959-biopygen23779